MMKSWIAMHSRTLRIAASVAGALLLAAPAFAEEAIVVPPVPFNLTVEAGNEPFFVGHAFGTQNYVCLPAGTGVGFSLFTPEATLLNDQEEQVITHFFSPNPDEKNLNPALAAIGPIRATWQHSRDGSSVWAQVQGGHASTDEKFVAKDSVAWLLLTKVGDALGADGGDVLTQTTFIQRLNTLGGVAPKTGCTLPEDVGHLAFVPYTADYFFFRKHPSR